MEKNYVKTSYTGCSYITAGKLYEVVSQDGELFSILDDDNSRISVCVNGGNSAHLNFEGCFECAEPKEEKMEQNEYKRFGQLSREEKLELMAAWIDGKDIEFYRKSPHEWIGCEDPLWESVVAYRIKPEPVEMPSIDWSHVHPDYKWLAVDENDSPHLFTEEPEKCRCCWDSDFGGAGTWMFSSYKRGNVAWDKSLVKRPEGV